MAKYATGKHALAISDRSGLQFPWREMVTEWNGSFVHFSEYEIKQPQLTPLPLKSEGIALWKVRPARAAFYTPTILPDDPFSVTNASPTVTVSHPNHGFSTGDAIRFREVRHLVGGVAISTLELETTLNGSVTATDTTITLTDSSAFPSSGYIYIQSKPPVGSTTQNTFTVSEVIKYTANDTGTGVLSGLTRGTSAPIYGTTPLSTEANAHDSGNPVFGSYSITNINTTVPQPAGVPDTTVSNSYTITLTANATSTVQGGGFPCFAGPVGDRP